ncbi:hypothetical protein ALC57_18518, partial [Trachymyrmex cornetzi]
IRLLQWNCLGMRQNFLSILPTIVEFNILCIQETLLKEKSNFRVKGFNIIRKDITEPGERGVCTLIRNNVTYEIVDCADIRHPSVEFLIIKILCKDSDPIIVANIYRHTGQNTPNTFF